MKHRDDAGLRSYASGLEPARDWSVILLKDCLCLGDRNQLRQPAKFWVHKKGDQVEGHYTQPRMGSVAWKNEEMCFSCTPPKEANPPTNELESLKNNINIAPRHG